MVHCLDCARRHSPDLKGFVILEEYHLKVGNILGVGRYHLKGIVTRDLLVIILSQKLTPPPPLGP